MIYKKFKELKISALGMGAMRLPVIEGVYANIDQMETDRMVAYAMEQGINYYDTAWGYHEGNSELAIGKSLAKYPRENFYLATKFPGYDLANMGRAEEIFEEQLKKCQVEYFDFYLIHNVCEMNIEAYLDPKYGIYDYFVKQKEKGRIRHLGFSAHGSIDVMKQFLKVYGDEMEFGQIQLNYLDWSFQDAKSKVALLEQYHLPVWIMEPLRGGSLSKLSEAHEKKLNALRPEEKIPAWAFRFVMSIPGVTVVLSGMSTFEQLEENIHTFEEEKVLKKTEKETLLGIAKEILSQNALPCTACRYCTSHCPQELDIPYLIYLYNEFNVTGGGFITPMVLSTLPDEKKPSACIGCRSCEQVCPQQIKISEVMLEFDQKVMA